MTAFEDGYEAAQKAARAGYILPKEISDIPEEIPNAEEAKEYVEGWNAYIDDNMDTLLQRKGMIGKDKYSEAHS